jgi:hypothetical protein
LSLQIRERGSPLVSYDWTIPIQPVARQILNSRHALTQSSPGGCGPPLSGRLYVENAAKSTVPQPVALDSRHCRWPSGGLVVAKALKHRPTHITLINRKQFPTKPLDRRSCAVGENMNRQSIFATAALAVLALASSSRAAAQDPADEDIKLFRKDLRSLRKQIIAANMDLSDKQAEQFWPLFEQYTQALVVAQGKK